MNVYLESSAALRDLLEGEHAESIRDTLRQAEMVATSRLTLAEVARVFARLRVLEPIIAGASAARQAQFENESELWTIYPVDEAIWTRCSRPFPVEPVRTLDALHLATVEQLSGFLGHLIVLSTDQRIRDNATALGFAVRP
ncbi:MAG: type II toxin-antitoxin system VapC family toxin [Myxococcota bacterium]